MRTRSRMVTITPAEPAHPAPPPNPAPRAEPSADESTASPRDVTPDGSPDGSNAVRTAREDTVDLIHQLVEQMVNSLLNSQQRTLLEHLRRAIDDLLDHDVDAGNDAGNEDARPVDAPRPEADAPATAPPTIITVVPRRTHAPPTRPSESEAADPPPPRVVPTATAVPPSNVRETARRAQSVVAYGLVVDHDVTRQAEIIENLDVAGVKAQLVTGRESTMRTLDRLAFDIILVSLALPNHESLDIVRDIRRRETKSTDGRRIAIYGLAEPRDRIDGGRALAIGLDGILDAVPSADTIDRLCDEMLHGDPAEPPEDPALIDASALASLQREPRETANRLLRHYLAAAARQISTIRRGISLGNLDTSEDACRSLRTASAPFGAVGVIEGCHTIEALIRSERPVKLRPLVEELDQTFRRTRHHLQAIVSEL